MEATNGTPGVTPRSALPAGAGASAERVSGIFAPISALPSEHGIGDMGPSAREFVDTLADGRQRIWQILPLAEPGNPANSPYDNHSGFAINRWLLSPDDLVEQGLLTSDDIARGRPMLPADRVDYGAMQAWKRPLIERAADNLLARADVDAALREELATFERRNHAWLDDYVNFSELKRRHATSESPNWSRRTWPVADRIADTAALPQRRTHEMRRTIAEQFLAEGQWNRLREHAGSRGVRLMSDLPFYEGDDGVTAWRRPELFELDDAHRATLVGGAPPEPAFPAGQSWGMPAYRTSERAALLEHFATRLEHEARRVGPGGIVRLDHLLGAAEPFYVPVEGVADDAARAGFRELFTGAEWKALLERFPDVTFVGEDLGDMTAGRRAFMDELAPSRMRVGLQSLMDLQPVLQSDHFADNVARTDVIFTGGTHDYPFMRSYLSDNWDSAPVRQLRDVLVERGLVAPGAGVDGVALGAMRLNLDSRANTAITQVFDVLGMGGDASLPAHLRAFNLPGTAGASNWATRIPSSLLDEGRGPFVDALASMAKLSNRA